MTSTPPGAGITIDGKATGKSTDFTFVVSPGNHSVAAISSNLPGCARQKTVSVRSGLVASIGCTSAGWGAPTYK